MHEWESHITESLDSITKSLEIITRQLTETNIAHLFSAPETTLRGDILSKLENVTIAINDLPDLIKSRKNENEKEKEKENITSLIVKLIAKNQKFDLITKLDELFSEANKEYFAIALSHSTNNIPTDKLFELLNINLRNLNFSIKNIIALKILDENEIKKYDDLLKQHKEKCQKFYNSACNNNTNKL